MSDLSGYNAAVDRMFDAAVVDIDRVARAWLGHVVDFLVIETRGPGNQKPETTLYYAQGVLRMGYHWSNSQPPGATAKYDGPSDDSYDADFARGKLLEELQDLRMGGEFWLWNDIAYGWIVHEGRGRHVQVGRDPWIEKTMTTSGSLFLQALAEIKR